jgi:hypothetical protein
MQRREFVILLGGSAAAWPLAARAQQPERMRRIGVLMGTAADDPESKARIAAFAQGLQQSGWTDGRNVSIDIRWGAGDVQLRPPLGCPNRRRLAHADLADCVQHVLALRDRRRAVIADSG